MKIYTLIKAIFTIKNIGAYYKDFKGKSNGEYTLNLYNQLKITLRANTSDRLIFNDIFLRNEYDLTLVKKDGIIIDVGSHIGLAAIYFSKKTNNIECFEPSKENFKLLKKNIEQNKLKIKLNNLAVSNKNGQIDLYSGNSFDTISTSSKTGDHYKVNTIDAKQITKKYEEIDLLKIDCEGEEFNIIPRLELNKINNIVMEYHLKNRKKEALNAIIVLLKKNKFLIEKKEYHKELGLIIARKIK
jgi:FkbM family methyltransferase